MIPYGEKSGVFVTPIYAKRVSNIKPLPPEKQATKSLV